MIIKKISSFLLSIMAFIFVILAGCNFSTGFKKDLKTGLSVSYKGFAINDAYLVDSHGKAMKDNKIQMDSSFSIIVTGVENYTLKGGKAYPACEIILKDNAGKVMGELPDILANIAQNGVSTKDASNLSARLTLHHPFISGNTYHVTARFYDKQNSKNELKADVDVLLQ